MRVPEGVLRQGGNLTTRTRTTRRNRQTRIPNLPRECRSGGKQGQMDEVKNNDCAFEMSRAFVGVNGEILRLSKPQQHVLEVLQAVESNSDVRGLAFIRQVDLSAEMKVSRKIVIKAIRNAEEAGLLATAVDRHQISPAIGCKAYRLTPNGVRLLAERRSQIAEAERLRSRKKTGLEKFQTDAELGIGVNNDWI